MSHEKLGAIIHIDGQAYRRRTRGVNLPSDFMTDEEISKLSGEVKIYYLEGSEELIND